MDKNPIVIIPVVGGFSIDGKPYPNILTIYGNGEINTSPENINKVIHRVRNPFSVWFDKNLVQFKDHHYDEVHFISAAQTFFVPTIKQTLSIRKNKRDNNITQKQNIHITGMLKICKDMQKKTKRLKKTSRRIQ